MIWEAIKTLAQYAGMGLAVLFFIALVVCSIAPFLHSLVAFLRPYANGVCRQGGWSAPTDRDA